MARRGPHLVTLPRSEMLEKDAFTSHRWLQRIAHSFKLTILNDRTFKGSGSNSIVPVIDTVQGYPEFQGTTRAFREFISTNFEGTHLYRSRRTSLGPPCRDGWIDRIDISFEISHLCWLNWTDGIGLIRFSWLDWTDLIESDWHQGWLIWIGWFQLIDLDWLVWID